MNELTEIVRAIQESKTPLFLATVVDVVGSSYRCPSAKMLIFPDGQHIGSISGGCLEDGLCRAAPRLVEEGPKLIHFDTRSETTEFNPRYNLGCSGIIYVLVEKITRDEHCPSRYLKKVVETDTPLVTATVYQSSEEKTPLGQRFLPAECLPKHTALQECFEKVRDSGRALACELVSGDTTTQLLIERIDPPKPFWIFGAGDDARPLAVMARELGWQVTVIDHRPSKLTPERFPQTRRLLYKPEAFGKLPLTPCERTAAVLMTHSFSADTDILPWLLKTPAGFVGILGPKSRTGKLMQELHSLDKLPSTESLDRLHTPVGLDIGAQAPAEIAVAILGEVIAEENQRSGGQLKNRQSAIREPVKRVKIEYSIAGQEVQPTEELT